MSRIGKSFVQELTRRAVLYFVRKGKQEGRVEGDRAYESGVGWG